MKKVFTFVVVGFLTVALAASAQTRKIHGVGGYYNFTAQQMKTDGLFPASDFFVEGTKLKGYERPAAPIYEGDEVKFIMGVNNANKQGLQIGKGVTTSEAYFWNVSFKFRPQEPMKITKDYPVEAWKVSFPVNAADSAKQELFSEFWWINPNTGKEETLSNKVLDVEGHEVWDPIKGIGSNARITAYQRWPNYPIQEEGSASKTLGMDSVKIGGSWVAKFIHSNGYLYDGFSGTWNSVTGRPITYIRLPQSSSEVCEFIILINYYMIPDITQSMTEYETGKFKYTEETHLLDAVPYIQIPRRHFNFFCMADTCDANGNAKPQDAWPYVKMKWCKTFESVEAAMDAISAENNWGDGTDSPVKEQLNSMLYYAEESLAGFKYRNIDPENPDDPEWMAYKEAYEEADAVYNNAASTDEDYQNAVVSLQEARIAFNAAIDIPTGLLYNTIENPIGIGSLAVGDEITVDNLTGKALTVKPNQAAAAFTFVPTGSVVNGQRTYYLRSKEGSVVQAKDGMLLVVSGHDGSTFSFGARIKGEEGEADSYDMKSGEYYYFLNDGVLDKVQEIGSDVSAYEDIVAYTFNIVDALEDYAANVEESEKTGLFEGWEFNSEPVDDPATKGMIDGEERVMAEYADTKMIDNWRMSRWRAFSRVNQAEYGDNNDKCLLLTSAPVYDNWDGSEAGVTNVYDGPAAMRYDSGNADPFYVRDPAPRDSAIAYNINAGLYRYFAIKMAGTEDVKFGTLTFLGSPSVIINRDQMKQIENSDVYYFDLLECGFTVGKMLFTSGFFSPEGFTSADSKLYIDWMRCYDTIENIPAESFVDASGIENVAIDRNESSSYIYNLQGIRVGEGYKGIVIKNGKKVLQF